MRVPDIIIAIDGYSSTGKSSFAKELARSLSFLHLDSGALYRAVTLHCIENSYTLPDGSVDERRLIPSLATLDVHFEYSEDGFRTYSGARDLSREIRTLAVSSLVSPVSVIPAVRNFVDGILHEYGRKGRVVMDGRDIGTAVFPQAQLKIFMVADDNVRAQRRLNEMLSKGETPDFGQVLANLKERDYIDSHRTMNPLAKAADAFVLDNSSMSIAEEIHWAKGLIQGRFALLEQI